VVKGVSDGMFRSQRSTWLSITPEPERELPRAVATLAHGGDPSPAAVAAETARIEQLVLHGTEREWLRYLHGVVELIDSRAADADAEVERARAHATAVISNHHNLLLGLPGRGARMSAADRVKLAQQTFQTAK
jgi:hypothetical protein